MFMRILTNLKENSETLDISLKSDFKQIKENLERVLPSDNLMLIEKMVIEVDRSEDLLFKSKRLLEISNILAEVVYCLDEFPSDYEDSGTMFKLSKFLTERTKTYSEIYQAFQLISDAETNKNLSGSEQFKKYASGFELLAMVLESKSEFISPEFLKNIELNADVDTVILTVTTEPAPLETNADGVVRVGKTRVTLDTVVAVFKQGATAEEIVSRYPSLKLADVYTTIGFYLNHQPEVEVYLQQRQQQAEEMRKINQAKFDPQGFRDKLLARTSVGESA
jgi:uncharacterized protein (DUF433 family)